MVTTHACDRISPAEKKVLEGLLLGLSNKAIAARLVLSHRTIESHVSNLLLKTGCSSRTQLLLWAIGEQIGCSTTTKPA